MSEYSMMVSTCSDKEAAKSIATLLLEERLAACVQMFPIESMYVWNGEVCDDSEVALLIKAKSEHFARIADAIKSNHSYETPEIIQIPITNGLPEYLKWIEEATT